ncbi:hypothetical protein BD626DRAFT_541310 [Schizophyllum amplum]|uniref:Uncharacterized protein n=1 Tax=Schizophyllum amplum TaxID=97359 RepID=A0A550BVB0_9AGAR|nr:hypothetical protein BD626DRAFT_541310 [Auriculariopsis ampla]
MSNLSISRTAGFRGSEPKHEATRATLGSYLRPGSQPVSADYLHDERAASMYHGRIFANINLNNQAVHLLHSATAPVRTTSIIVELGDAMEDGVGFCADEDAGEGEVTQESGNQVLARWREPEPLKNARRAPVFFGSVETQESDGTLRTVRLGSTFCLLLDDSSESSPAQNEWRKRELCHYGDFCRQFERESA